MNKTRLASLAALIGVFTSLLFPLQASALGLATGPSEGIEIIDAVRGQEYQGIIFVKYISDAEDKINLKLTANGDISDWVSFYELNKPTSPIEYLTVPAGKLIYIQAKFTIPSDAAIGNAEGLLIVEAALQPNLSNSTSVSLRGSVPVIIHVAQSAQNTETSTSTTPVPTEAATTTSAGSGTSAWMVIALVAIAVAAISLGLVIYNNRRRA